MKKTILMLLFIFLFAGQTVKAADQSPDISARSAIVYHADSGRVLYEKQADMKMLIASTTKIMTGLIAIENCDLNDSVMITEEMAGVEGSSMYLKAGEAYTLRELLYGLLLASGNDAATAIAMHVAGDEDSFARLMNEKAAELGMKQSNFENPHGLDGKGHCSTALDMAKLASYAMENEVFAEIVGTRHITIKNLTYVNHNKLLWQCDGVIGIKTGYTMAAGRTLVSCCERDGQRLICVTLSAPDDWNDHRKLYDWAYGVYQERLVLDVGTKYQIPLMSGNNTSVFVEPLSNVTVFADDNDEIDYYIELPRFVFEPVHKGDRAGQIVVTVDGVKAAEVQLVYMENHTINIEKPFGFDRLVKKLKGN